jgi:hypothetical protein
MTAGLQCMNPRGKELPELKKLDIMEGYRKGGNLVMLPDLSTLRSVLNTWW